MIGRRSLAPDAVLQGWRGSFVAVAILDAVMGRRGSFVAVAILDAVMGRRGSLVSFASWASYAGLAIGAAACAPRALDLTPLAPLPPVAPAPGTTAFAAGAPRACPDLGDAPCGGASAVVCTDRALAMWSESRGERSVACVEAMLAEACSLDDARACGFAGRMVLDGRGAPRDPARAMTMLLRACDEGYVTACAVGSRAVGDPDGSDVKGSAQQRARFDLEQSCWSGQGDACYRAGLLFATGRESFPADAGRAVALYARGCDLGDSRACNNFGDALAYGDGVVRDTARAASLFETACRLGESLGCANLGYMKEHGEGVVRDMARARSLYRDACVSGDPYGCIHTQMMAAQDAGAPRDPARVLAYWTDACDRRRDANACAFEGILYEDGPDGLARDEAKSERALARACELGHARACEWTQAHDASSDDDDE